jgi:hypothetical protein
MDARDPGRSRVLAARVEARGILEAGVFEPESLSPLVHLLDELVHAGFAPSAAEVLGQGVGGVGAGGDQGRREEPSPLTLKTSPATRPTLL